MAHPRSIAVALACITLSLRSAVASAQPSPPSSSHVEITSDTPARIELRASPSTPAHECSTPCHLELSPSVYWLAARPPFTLRAQIAATAPRNRLLLHLPHADPIGIVLTAAGATAVAAAASLMLASRAIAPSYPSLLLLYAGVYALVASPALLIPGVLLLARSPSQPWIERLEPPRDSLANPLIVRALSPSLSLSFVF